MPILKDFKEFIMRGNVLDLAVAVVVGGAFKDVVTSLTDSVITPLLLAPALKMANLQDIDKLAWGTVKYGTFLSNILKFLIIAFILFLLVKAFKTFERKKEEAPPAGPSSTDQLLMEIRDELKKKAA